MDLHTQQFTTTHTTSSQSAWSSLVVTGNTRNTVGPPASVLLGSHPHRLVSVSQEDLVLLRSGLKQGGLHCLPCLHQGATLSQEPEAQTDLAMFRLTRYSLCMDPQRAPLATIPLLLRA
jgi:hypothetical protein